MTWRRTATEAMVLRTAGAHRVERDALRLAIAELIVRGDVWLEPPRSRLVGRGGARLVSAGAGGHAPPPLATLHAAIARAGADGLTTIALLRAVRRRWGGPRGWVRSEVIPVLAGAGLVALVPRRRLRRRTPAVELTDTGRAVRDDLALRHDRLQAAGRSPLELSAVTAAASPVAALAEEVWERVALREDLDAFGR